jgi:hypothetical protein
MGRARRSSPAARSKGGAQSDEPGARRRRWLRRPAVWVGGVATAVLIGVVTPVAQEGLADLTRGSPTVTGPAAKVAALRLEQDESETYVFPTRMDLGAGELRTINEAYHTEFPKEQYDRWARAHGGVDDYAVNIKLVLEGNRPAPIRILGMRPIKHCRDPLTGTLFLSPSAGADSSVRIGINLDEPRPIARKLQGGMGLTGDYFAEKTVSLKQGEQQTFQITAATIRSYCEFTLELTILDNGNTITQEIKNGSQPFRVSAVKTTGEWGSPGIYSSYQALYVGGVLTTPGGAFVRVDPSTYDETTIGLTQ